MIKYKVVVEGEEQDEIFDTEDEAEEYARYCCSCVDLGAEILHMSNKGDYSYSGGAEYEYEIIEVEIDE